MKNANLALEEEKIIALNVIHNTNLEMISRMIKNVMKNVHITITMILITIMYVPVTILVLVI